MRRESRGITFVRRGIVKMKKFSSPLEQISGQIAGLVVYPAGSKIERNSFARCADFDGAKAIQNLFDLIQSTLRQQKEEIVVAEPRGNVRAAAGFFRRRASSLSAASTADLPYRELRCANSST